MMFKEPRRRRVQRALMGKYCPTESLNMTTGSIKSWHLKRARLQRILDAYLKAVDSGADMSTKSSAIKATGIALFPSLLIRFIAYPFLKFFVAFIWEKWNEKVD
jgi:hypothetical protein